MPHVPSLSLRDGTTIPQLGFGVWQVEDDVAETAVSQALADGYRLIDTAKIYGNEEGVGRAIAASGVAREDIYLTTKLWNKDHGRGNVRAAFEGSLERLGVDYVDLYLIHWPCPKDDLYIETYQAMIELRAEGRVKSIGVSNFLPYHLKRLIDETGDIPVVNQIELHPYHSRPDLRELHHRYEIATEAYSPLSSGHGLLDNEVVVAVAKEAGVTPAQAVLAWHLAIGNVVIPKSVTPERITQNLQAVDVELTEDQVAAVSALERAQSFGSNPDEVYIDLWG
ncbi:oxidoreductase [Bowdeniella nasicola]|uniref:Oxidoreductase n=1 Tax=Bowdeniella nasicola TaxID=208480 RepID=A0A1Q5Q3C6_9ACTO|nr:aldo/keto reductase [Bowdeniella nasicola]OKL54334.1 oxidoreductase [Bowdeniella nasicola]